MAKTADQNAGQPLADVVDLNPRCPLQQVRKNNARLQSGQRGADAEVDTFAEGQMVLGGGPIKPEFVRPVELGRVSVGSAPEKQQVRIGRQRDTGKGGVATDMPVVAAERRLVTQNLFDEWL